VTHAWRVRRANAAEPGAERTIATEPGDFTRDRGRSKHEVRDQRFFGVGEAALLANGTEAALPIAPVPASNTPIAPYRRCCASDRKNASIRLDSKPDAAAPATGRHPRSRARHRAT
jgi:hypothetical protein